MIEIKVNCVWVDDRYARVRACVRYPAYAWNYPEYIVKREQVTMQYTLEEAKQELDKLKESLFYLQMKDHWDTMDYNANSELNRIIRLLEQGIKVEG